ncbi:dehydrogenase [Rhodohalobacter sp. SW132]|uniref:PVC-type heme-binding CxxCH protein n=1 Tax=Rhodohalobacter sp. SW132 TaxID=2293433 RepID=UPI000E2775BD|nr:PVC-type heme-binding CxxCH protein [Rhodohalobacter sp. SW132]REL37591.1 dehydrogenase [Rhodohalobacter sp. SW132]
MKNYLLQFSTIFALLLIAACATQETTSTQQQESAPETAEQEEPRKSLEVLFLGDDGHHNPKTRIQTVIPYLAEHGIHVHYTDRQSDLNRKTLDKYDVFMLYGNRSGLTREQEHSLLSYIADGGGFVALHSASASFNDSDAFVNLVGGAFKAHGAGTFSTRQVVSDHPVLEGVPEIESWDETYVHMKHNPDRTVLSVRVEGDHEEPWTWVRNHGDGRVFYTAWGHDERTWSNDGFKQLLQNSLRWTAGDWALDADFSKPELAFGDGELPNYPAGESWGTVDDPITQVQLPLSPEESREHIVVDPDFEVVLFASEPDIVNPIDMTWDERGRLWVLETVDYPNDFKDEREGNDRIKILEDTTGDGKADEITVFAEGLNIATSLVLANGGVIVAQAPDFFFLQDTNGDGKADHKEVIMTGWGDFDTHAGPSNLQYGIDNHIWGAVGYSAFDGTVGNERHRFSSGFYRFTPNADSLEYISNTSNNTWGLGFNEEGFVFGSTANRNPAVQSAVPNRFYRGIRGVGSTPTLPMIANTSEIYPIMEEIRQVDQHGHYTAGSGFHIYTARNYPESYWNSRAFVGEPTGQLLGEFILEEEGSHYHAHNAWNFLSSLDEWFSPTQTKVGPDGALWMVDWYNIIIQHNPFPNGWERGEGNAYVTDLRDVEHARIYRIVYKGDENADENFSLENATEADLVDALTHTNMFWRLTAQRLLVENGNANVLPDLYEMVNDRSVDQLGLNPGALHALWTMHGLGALDGNNAEAFDVAAGALHHPANAVRRAALMTLPRNETARDLVLAADFVPNPEAPGDMGYTMPATTMMSSSLHVRLAALLALAEMPASDKAGQAVAEMIVMSENANDRWLRDAASAAAAKNEVSFLDHVFTKHLPESADSTYKENVATAMERVGGHYALGEYNGDVSKYLSGLPDADPTLGAAFVGGLAEGWPEGEAPQFSDSERNSLSSLRANLPEEYDEHLDALAEKWESSDIFGNR